MEIAVTLIAYWHISYTIAKLNNQTRHTYQHLRFIHIYQSNNFIKLFIAHAA